MGLLCRHARCPKKIQPSREGVPWSVCHATHPISLPSRLTWRFLHDAMAPLVQLAITRLLRLGTQRSIIHRLRLRLRHLSNSRVQPIQPIQPTSSGAARPHPTIYIGDTPRPISGSMAGNHNRPLNQLTRPTLLATTQPSGRPPPIDIPSEAVTSNCVTRWNRINSPVDLSSNRHAKGPPLRTGIQARHCWAQTVDGHSPARGFLLGAWTHLVLLRVVPVWPRMYTHFSTPLRRPSVTTKTSPMMLASESVCNDELRYLSYNYTPINRSAPFHAHPKFPASFVSIFVDPWTTSI